MKPKYKIGDILRYKISYFEPKYSHYNLMRMRIIEIPTNIEINKYGKEDFTYIYVADSLSKTKKYFDGTRYRASLGCYLDETYQLYNSKPITLKLKIFLNANKKDPNKY